MKASKIVATFFVCCFPYVLATTPVDAAAPPRVNQPYAEARCNTDPNILLCEDFNYTQNHYCEVVPGPGHSTSHWTNPGWSVGVTFNADCQAGDFPAASGFATAPGVGGNVFRARPSIDPGGSAFTGCILGDCDRNTGDTPGFYQNGAAATKDLYFRFQIYNSPNWYWPDWDNKILFLYPNQFSGKTAANVDAGLDFNQDTFCSPNTLTDALTYRVGNNGPNSKFKKYPADANIEPHNTHFEYCSGNGAPNGQFGDATVPVATGPKGSPSNCNPNPGTLFRMCRGRWYTLEFRYKLSSPGVQNGTIETWIDGVKIYGDNDLETCGDFGSSEGSCYAIHEINFLNSWFFSQNANDWANAQACNCYRLIDNFIISKSYIGPPTGAGGGSDITPPNPPANLRIL